MCHEQTQVRFLSLSKVVQILSKKTRFMKHKILSLLLLSVIIGFTQCIDSRHHNKFSVKNGKTYLNNREILLKGLRLSNALISDEAVDELINNLDTFAYYGVNSVSVYFQGSRFGDLRGYREDASIDPVYAGRMSRIIEAADEKGFVVLVGCLYWSTSSGKWESWTQEHANLAVANTVKWLKEHNYRNVFVDVDNEGMARAAKKFNNQEMVKAGKNIDNSYVIATNFHGDPPAEADMAIHYSNRISGKPYAETEGSAPFAPGGYWGSYSKQGAQWNNGPDLYQYINIGVYTDSMKAGQIEKTYEHFKRGEGYFLASTWLQCVPPEGPHHSSGGYGNMDDPGIRWWLEAVRDWKCGKEEDVSDQ